MGWFSGTKDTKLADDEYIFRLPTSHYNAHTDVLDKVECTFGEVLIWIPNVADFLACGDRNRSDLAFRLSAICTHTSYKDFLAWEIFDAMKVVTRLNEYLQDAMPTGSNNKI